MVMKFVQCPCPDIKPLGKHFSSETWTQKSISHISVIPHDLVDSGFKEGTIQAKDFYM